jgi:putative phosphoesterase
MKIGLVSDVHGDAETLVHALQVLRAHGAERIMSCGDLVGYGPHPDEVATVFAENAVRSVRGNHDRWALQRPAGTPDEFGGATPSAATLEFLRQLPSHLILTAGARRVVIVHGSPRSDMEFVLRRTHPPDRLRTDLVSLEADLLVVGHTHEPMWYRCDRGLVVNPGSVIALPAIRSSRSVAVVDLEYLTAGFYDAHSGRPIEVPPWLEETPDPDAPPRTKSTGRNPCET